MYHRLKKFRKGEKITLWLLEKKWEVVIEWYNHHCLLGSGWSLFARDVEFRGGDTCVFECTDDLLEYNVYVFRQEEYDSVMFNAGYILFPFTILSTYVLHFNIYSYVC